MPAILRARIARLSRLELIESLRKAGLSSHEIAELLGENPRTLRREMEERILPLVYRV